MAGSARRGWSATAIALTVMLAGVVPAPSASAVTAPPPNPHSFNNDPFPDMLAASTDGNLYLYATGRNNQGVWAGPRSVVGRGGWQRFAQVISSNVPTDFAHSYNTDILALNAAGQVVRYLNLFGLFSGPLVILDGVKGAQLVTPGDWDGDGLADLIVRMPNGDLRLYRGTTAFHLVVQPSWTTIGKGWGPLQVFATGPGHSWDGDSFTDLVARYPNGDLQLWKGNGRGGFLGHAVIGKGWGQFDLVLPGAWFNTAGVLQECLVARTPSGDLRVYFVGRLPSTKINTSFRVLGRGWGIYRYLV